MKRFLFCLWSIGCNSTAPPKPPIDLSDNWCDRIVAGPSGAGTTAEVSRAHAGIRFFGPQANYPAIDAALAAALQQATMPDLDLYAKALGACALAASPSPLPSLAPATVKLEGDVALIHPGTGAVTLPAGAKAVAIDLRDLPPLPELDAALQSAIATALATPFPRSGVRRRTHFGMDDEVLAPGMNIYSQSLKTVSRQPLAPAGTADLPILLLTGAKMTPVAADWAEELRLQGRAVLVGASVFASVAEAEWSPIGQRGLRWRKQQMNLGGIPWPDELAADLRSDDPEHQLAQARALKIQPIDLTTQSFDRPLFDPFDVTANRQSTNLDIGVMRAALYTFHGALRRFFTYFDVVGDNLDARLDQLLMKLQSDSSVDRLREEQLLEMLANAIRDGHFEISDPLFVPAAGSGYVAITMDWFGELPIVHSSKEPLLHPGDTVTAIDGLAIADWYAMKIPLVSAATDGAVKLRAWLSLTNLPGPSTWAVQDSTGASREVMLQPGASPNYPPLVPTRASGFLTDLGAPDIFYFNLDGGITNNPTTLGMQQLQAHDAAGVVLDMRGYPGAALDFPQFGEWIGMTWKRPQYAIPTWDGADTYTLEALPQETEAAPADPAAAYSGPLVWLVGPYTQSAAEDFSMEILDSGRIKKVVGRTSAGSDGNITGLVLPGGYKVTFTGMNVHFPDGKPFDAVGIVPDVVVPPSPGDLAAGIDSDLMEAIHQLQN